MQIEIERLKAENDDLYYRMESASERHHDAMRQAERKIEDMQTDLYVAEDRLAATERKLRHYEHELDNRSWRRY